jgi:hypothetical protein
MLRLALLAIAALLVGGCRTAADADHTGSPSGSIAGTEAKQDRLRTKPAHAASATNSGLANSLIAVTATSASEAQPCERMCGSLGDCLFADDDYTTIAAGGLELQCLDMCVHSPDGDPAKTEFLACGSHSTCDQLQACAERNWLTLAASRRGPEIAGVVGSAIDPCQNGCWWTYACMGMGKPPIEAYVDENFEREVQNSCVDRCDEMAESERVQWITMGECLPNHCSSVEDSYHCLGNF